VLECGDPALRYYLGEQEIFIQRYLYIEMLNVGDIIFACDNSATNYHFMFALSVCFCD